MMLVSGKIGFMFDFITNLILETGKEAQRTDLFELFCNFICCSFFRYKDALVERFGLYYDLYNFVFILRYLEQVGHASL